MTCGRTLTIVQAPGMVTARRWLRAGAVALAGVALLAAAPAPRAGLACFQAVPEDAFPVFDHPPMLPAAEAEARNLVFDRDAVIGAARGREAKAYPIAVMGVHGSWKAGC